MSLKKGIICSLAALTMLTTVGSLTACNNSSGEKIVDNTLGDYHYVVIDDSFTDDQITDDPVIHNITDYSDSSFAYYTKCRYTVKFLRKNDSIVYRFIIIKNGIRKYTGNLTLMNEDAVERAVENGIEKCPECFSEHEQE